MGIVGTYFEVSKNKILFLISKLFSFSDILLANLNILTTMLDYM